MSSTASMPGFFDRALYEARRYGSDPWVFVRELLQNARDAGAWRASFRVEQSAGLARVHCRDDGEGMTFEHARRFLFVLYASSKEGRRDRAGRFGVGFWSVLRFEPTRITVRSWPRHGEPWAVVLEGDLGVARRVDAPDTEASGTEIVLERAPGAEGLQERIFAAAWDCARHVGRRDAPRSPLIVTVNGRRVNAPFALPAPSASFQRGTLRGVVALGRSPRVELLSKGLRVRSAFFLHDLLSAGAEPDRTRPALVDGLAPQMVLDGEDLELLLSRGDARDDRALRRLVGLAQRELDHLIDAQLDGGRRRSPWRRALDRVRPRVPGFPGSLASLAAAAGLAFVLGACWWSRGDAAGIAGPGEASTRAAAWVVPWPARPPDGAWTGGYRDLATAYRGPRMEQADAGVAPISLRYEPRRLRLFFAAIAFDRLDHRGQVVAGPVDGRPYDGAPCASECVDIALRVTDGPGPVRLPVPTGHRLDPENVRLNGRALPVVASATDEALVVLPAPVRSTIEYRTGPAQTRPPAFAGAEPIPVLLAPAVADLARHPAEERVARAVAWVRGHVAYSNDAAVAARHDAAEAAGMGFVERTLSVGAGDCDVQNGLLMLLLKGSRIPARLVVGYLGEDGSAAPWLHAWVEYHTGSGPWRVADASQGAVFRPSTLPTVAGPLPSQGSASVAAHVGSRAATTPPSGTAVPGSALGAALGLLSVAGAWLALRARTRRRLHLDGSPDVARLLLGALQQPDAFGAYSAVFHRPLVPMLDRRPLCLARAWELASGGRLYATQAGSPLARAAARMRVPVLDGRLSEGAAVAQSLGAVDLDAWDEALARSRSSPLVEAVNEHLRGHGELIQVRIGRAAAPSSVLELPVRRFAARRIHRIVLVDEREAWWVEASARASDRRAQAAFDVTDRVLERLALPEPARARLLSPLARAAVLEAGGR